LCRRAGVHLHLRSDDKEGPFAADEIGQFVRNARSVWFCGPAAWGRTLQRALQRNAGLAAERFLREQFEFR
ncbi:MAG: ferric reductase, partial [Propionivibrio sp.]